MNLPPRLKFLMFFLPIVAIAALSCSGSVFAGDYPTTTIRMICSSGAGGTSDFVSRAIAEPLSDCCIKTSWSSICRAPTGPLHPSTWRVQHRTATRCFSASMRTSWSIRFFITLTYDPFRDFAPISVIVRVRLVLMFHLRDRTRCRS